MRGDEGRRARGEQGASFVEFALIFPIFMTIVLGMLSGGLTYNRKIGMTNAVAEASRYGATLAPSTLVVSPPPDCAVVGGSPAGACGLDEWVKKVAAAVVKNAGGDLDASVDDRRVCVAYVHPQADTTLPHNQISHMVTYTSSDTTPSSQASGPGARCMTDDGRPAPEKRVQVVVSRSSPLDALFFEYPLALTAQSVTRFEAFSY